MIDLEKDIQYVKGIGPKKAYKLNKLGIFTLKDLIFYFPRQFEDRNNLKKIIQLQNNDKATIKAVIVSINTTTPKKGMILTKIEVRDETGYAKLVFFNQPHIKNLYKCGDTILVFGKVKKEFKTIELSSCEIEHLTNDPKNTCKVMPIYPLTYGVTNKEIISIIKSVLSNEELKIKEYLPQRIIEKYKLCSIEYAIKNIHNPTSKESLKIALYRIVFEEFLILQLGLFMFKNGANEEDGIKFRREEDLDKVLKALPFKLTNAQNRALNEIIDDMKSDKVMNRLVQGDVGSGKTVVALLALANCVLNGYQGALMAPTEILAEQHYISLSETLDPFGINIELLVGSLTKKQKESVLERVKNNEVDILIGTHALIEDKVEFNNLGIVITDEQHRFGVRQRNKLLERVKNNEVDILIGTHALIEDKVEFNNLGIVITDEQHRFGVRQRNKLSEKGINPDILVMTATPIPRTLALILYGDLDISIIDELPPGRQPIETLAIDKSKRDNAYNSLVRKEVEKGRQVYIVCPLVEESEAIEAKAATELVDELKLEYFSDLRVGLLHGKMKSSEKDEIMKSFKNKEIDILVSTTVIEVGVNVPNATLMIIENAERFGLAQLHQLRGRVGRGSHKSYCILIYASKSEVCRQRMSIMEETNDGFKISEKDNSLVRKEVEKGRQVYIVCPLVEESEAIEAKAATELVEELKLEYFSDLRVGLLHGKMKSSEKDEIMKSFKNKEIDILVSTTVIEVGVNVPNATLMIIENAERFGLAQLHQLRGRVGRGSHKSYCILIYASKSEVCRQRMSIMEETNDGFKISEKDLEIRGPGEFFGTRQHGLPELKVANIFKHMKILKLAQQEARYIIGLDHKLQNYENSFLKKEIMSKFEHSVKEISLN